MNRPMRCGTLMILTLGLCWANALQGQELIKRALDQSIDEAAQEAAQKLKATQFQDVNNIAVLPFWGDCSDEIKQHVTRTFQDQIIGGRYRVMERSDAAWNNLLGEIEWSALREDIMNQTTLQQFGRIVGCDAVVYGTIRECAGYPQRNEAVTRLSLTLGVVETGEARWSSGEIKRVTVLSASDAVPVDVDPALARAVTRAAQAAAGSLKAQAAGLSGFALFPLQGKDADAYIGGVLQGELAKVGANPIPVSNAQWQEYLVANSQSAQSVEAMRGFAQANGHPALLHGSVNEREVEKSKYKATVRFTLTLVDAESGRAIWSPGEVVGSAWLDGRDIVAQAVRDPLVWVLAGIIVLLVILGAVKRLFKAAGQPR